MLEKLGENTRNGDPALLKGVFTQQVEKALAWADSQDKTDLMSIDYEETLENPQGIANRLVNFLKQGDSAAMAAAVEPSLRTIKASQ